MKNGSFIIGMSNNKSSINVNAIPFNQVVPRISQGFIEKVVPNIYIDFQHVVPALVTCMCSESIYVSDLYVYYTYKTSHHFVI